MVYFVLHQTELTMNKSTNFSGQPKSIIATDITKSCKDCYTEHGSGIMQALKKSIFQPEETSIKINY